MNNFSLCRFIICDAPASSSFWVMVAARPRTPNRGAPFFNLASLLTRFFRSDLAWLPHAKPGFCFGGRPGRAVARCEAGLVIPAYCLTAENSAYFLVIL